MQANQESGSALEAELLHSSGTPKRQCSYRGEAVCLIQVGGNNFIFWDVLDDSMYRVCGNLTVEKFVAGSDEDRLNAFDLEEI
ncbi:hypothetical protein LB507_004142 [Fusarium sp. FIESC RH6]|nr:hypothetical protein LB507_004142 [Fusarium sp. FIESC RH6]